MNSTQRNEIMQRWRVVQHELLPELKSEFGALTPKLEKVIHTLEWVRIDAFVGLSWCGTGRPPHDRAAMASAYVAKAVLGLTTTTGLIERLTVDRALKRICGFAMWKRLPGEATFPRAFAEFAAEGLAERAHESLVKETLVKVLVGHISRDGTAIESREKPARKERVPAATQPRQKRGRPKQGEVREAKPSKLEQQQGKPLTQLLKELPSVCDRGTKSNAPGYKNSWNGYKLHLDTADCGIPVMRY